MIDEKRVHEISLLLLVVTKRNSGERERMFLFGPLVDANFRHILAKEETRKLRF